MEGAAAIARSTAQRQALRRFVRNRTAILGAALTLALALMAAVGPLIAPHDPLHIDMDLGPPPHPPSAQHLLGTDSQGRDIVSRLLWGGHITLGASVLTVAMAMGIGAPLGLLAGYHGGRFDQWSMRLMDALLSFPSLLLALAIVAALGTGLRNAVFAVAIVYVPRFARVVRGSALQERSRDYVAAAQALGAGVLRTVGLHVFPNCMAPLVVMATLSLATVILEIAALSFLGLGVRPPSPEWGAMLNEGRDAFLSHPHVMIAPGVAIVLAVLGINLMGDGLRDALDPKQSES